VPHVSDEAVCIRHWDFSETSQTVSLFTRGHGVLRGLAKGAKRAGGRFSGGIDLLARGQVVAIVKPGRELATLTDWTLLGTYRSVRMRLDANQAAYYLIDLVQRLIADADPHERLYDALVAALESIDAGDPIPPAVLLYQWIALDEGGYRPLLELPETTAQTLRFSPGSGAIRASESDESADRGHGWKVRRSTVELLAEIARLAEAWPGGTRATALLEGAGAVCGRAGAESVARANRLLAAYVRHIHGAQLETMRALFPDI
jgi:DNA repair protein RecO